MSKPHPEYEALYAAVCAAPEDDTPRLVLADWLDEHDDPHRAAFIRAQIGLAQARESDPHAAAVFDFFSDGSQAWGGYCDPAAISPTVARMVALEAQAKKHKSKAQKRWKAALPPRKSSTIYSYQRGFPYCILLNNVKQYVRQAEEGGAEPFPGYELLIGSRNESELDALLACGRLAGATAFGGNHLDSPEFVRKLGAHNDARHLQRLRLYPHSNTPAILAALAAEKNWARLRHLYVYAYGEGAYLPDEFLRAKHFQGLQSLQFELSEMTGASAAALARMKWPHLRTLAICGSQLDATGAKGIAAEVFPELRTLTLSHNRVGNAGAAALAGARKMNALATLDLSYDDITDGKALAKLIAGPVFPELVGLNLMANGCRALDAKVLTAPGRGPKLRLLSLRHCALGSKSAEALARAPALTGLVALDLAGNKIGDAGVKAIVKYARWDGLTCLDLSGAKITAAGVRALVAWPQVAQLAHLDLGGNPIGLGGAKELAACPALKKCRKLVVPFVDRGLCEKGEKLLRDAFGKRLSFGH
jgi:uncharacterized protein (TIGR02996 family)